jgi:hypothetical protein
LLNLLATAKDVVLGSPLSIDTKSTLFVFTAKLGMLIP